MTIGIDAVSIVSLFTECILYGFFAFLFSVSIYVLIHRRRSKREPVNRPMLVVSCVMFVLATVHVGSDLKRVMIAYLEQSDAVKYFSEVNTAIYSLKSTAYCMQTLVGDGFMWYRLYLIWGGDKRICFPILICFIASIGVGIGALQAFARASPEAPVFITELQDWIVSFFSLTLFTNFSCTILIAARILYVHRRMSAALANTSTKSVFPAAMIIIESGSIYSACLIILLSLYLSGSFAQYIMLDAVTQMIGIVFSLIIVRVGLGLSTDAVEYASGEVLSTFAAGKDRGHRSNGSSAYVRSPMRRNNSRPPRPVFTLSSFAATKDSMTDTTVSSSDITDSDFDPTKKYQPFDGEGKIPEDTEDLESGRSHGDPIDIGEDMTYAENLEMHKRIRVTQTVETSRVL